MFKKLKIFFEHNRTERNGTIALLVFMILIVGGTYCFSEFYTPPAKDLRPLAQYIQSQSKANAPSFQDSIQIELFKFNPNTLTDSGFRKLGFSEREIRTLRNYQKTGAQFEKKSDFKKLFFVDSAEYDKLKFYIQLPDSVKHKKPAWKKPEENIISWSDTSTYKPYEVTRVELNTADTVTLKSVYGIGSFYARQIVDYRAELGGYYNLGQLLELWKMDRSKIDSIADQVYIDPSFIQKLSINNLTTQELAKHPYIDLHLASKIIYSREAEGNFNDVKDLIKRKLVNEELSSKLAPYLDFH